MGLEGLDSGIVVGDLEGRVIRNRGGPIPFGRVRVPDFDQMNLGLAEAGGDVLVVSQFTLYGDTAKGRRPSFVNAAPPEVAFPLYERFVGVLRELAPGAVETGVFGAGMDLELVNDGPVTLVLERE